MVAGDLAIRGSLVQTLGAAGYEVSTAPGFAAAPGEKLPRPDLLILDGAPPPEKAREMIGRIRETYVQVRILVISPDLSPESLKEADLLGAESVVTKPLNHAKLLAGVRTLLRRRPAVY